MERAERFRDVFESTYATVARYARNQGYRGADAEDLVASTFEVVWRRLDVVPSGERAIPWILTVARNMARNSRRKSAREEDLITSLTALAPPPSDVGVDLGSPSWQDVRIALDGLKPIDRELVLLVAWDELTLSDAGEVLGLSPTAARSRLHRARQRLAVLLHDSDYNHSASGQSASGPTTQERHP